MKYTNKQLQEICRVEWHIFNNHNFAAGQPFLSYTGAYNGRAGRSAHWSIDQDDHNLNESGFWRDMNSKVFSVYRKDEKEPQFEAAKAWANKKFGIEEWARGPFGAYYDKAFCEQRIAEIVAKHENSYLVKKK